ncbi:DUF7130 family rubredoxin-like protein [Halopelagius longus]|uniref:DUF7130 domain-containing protein n=1 Tax=Halopelagius longus TaxID=1236180 RepID=A0A1H0YG66_9EURY|nr:hypothetical protein [Halopelagius longus]RDI72466.1 hypothetical protein DWB78_12480 [Halopelagius longus]SDQ14030.1 hypothetical protein SAMN05216278_0610 [Halopelagius longus]
MSSRTSSQRHPPRRRPRARVDPKPSIDAGPATAANARARSRSRTRTARPTPDATPRDAARGGDGAFLVWYCAECGAVGSVASFPPSCPDCSAGRGSLSYWPEN